MNQWAVDNETCEDTDTSLLHRTITWRDAHTLASIELVLEPTHKSLGKRAVVQSIFTEVQRGVYVQLKPNLSGPIMHLEALSFAQRFVPST